VFKEQGENYMMVLELNKNLYIYLFIAILILSNKNVFLGFILSFFIFYKLVPKKYRVADQLGWPKSSPTWSGDTH
jgi:hypothetical protein